MSETELREKVEAELKLVGQAVAATKNQLVHVLSHRTTLNRLLDEDYDTGCTDAILEALKENLHPTRGA